MVPRLTGRAMPHSFIERRYDFREPVDEGSVDAGGRHYRLINWSVGGFLAEGEPAPGDVGEQLPVSLTLRSGGNRFAFTAVVRVVRAEQPAGFFAARFEHLDPTVTAMVHRHFNPFGVSIRGSAGAYAQPAAPPVRPVEPEPEVTAAALSQQWSRDTAAFQQAAFQQAAAQKAAAEAKAETDPDEVRRQLARLKAAVARRYHPDSATDGTDRRQRAEIFTRVWSQLEQIESGLSPDAFGRAQDGGRRRLV